MFSFICIILVFDTVNHIKSEGRRRRKGRRRRRRRRRRRERDRQRKGQTDKRMSKEIVHEKEQRKMHFKMDIQNV